MRSSTDGCQSTVVQCSRTLFPLLALIRVLCVPHPTCHAGILEETTNKGNKELEKALFSHADAVTNKFFGDAVYYR